MAEKAILYDATRCTACRGCQAACKQWNGNDEAIPTAGWRPSAERKHGVERTDSGTRVSANRSTVEEALDPAQGPMWGRRERGSEDSSGA